MDARASRCGEREKNCHKKAKNSLHDACDHRNVMYMYSNPPSKEKQQQKKKKNVKKEIGQKKSDDK